MRFVISLFLLVVLTGILFADEKARYRASWQWATSCQAATCQPVQVPVQVIEKQPAAKEGQEPVPSRAVQTETISVGSCSSGSCSAYSSGSTSRFSIFRRRR